MKKKNQVFIAVFTVLALFLLMGCKEEHTCTGVEWVMNKQPNCRENGEKILVCSCGNQLDSIIIPALGHTEVIDEGKASTCTEEGLTEGSHCSVCGMVLIEQEPIPISHAYEDGICKICGQEEPKEDES